ncbi:MAG: gram-negative porin family protein [Ramlibacter sp.]|nr:gram-negative porin family protein [Ramlibacter sp.]
MRLHPTIHPICGRAMARNAILAAAALAACELAAAQSSATLFGVVDAAFQHGTGSIAGRTQLGNSGLALSRIGFRGKEDLGAGLWASFWLEAGIQNDTGQGVATNGNNQPGGAGPAGLNGGQGLTFNRRSTVSIGGPWGELRLGRDFTPQYYNLTYDVTAAIGLGTPVNVTNIITGVTFQRASNAVSYFSPKVAGFFGQAQVYFGENSSNSAGKDDGKGAGIRIGYAAGPLEVAAATSRTQYLAGDSRQSNIGGSYDFGALKLFANYSHDRGLVRSGPATLAAKANGWAVSASAPFGSNELRATFSEYRIVPVDGAIENPRARKLAATWVHEFTKPTAIYATVAHVTNSGGSATALLGAATGANQSSTGYEAGIRHSF